jgi:hypothetical protein
MSSSMGSVASTATTSSLPPTTPSFGGLGSINDSMAPPGLYKPWKPVQFVQQGLKKFLTGCVKGTSTSKKPDPLSLGSLWLTLGIS